MNDLITVIVPVYNIEKYLAGCIESIIGQTYSNLEILLVNDGSTDSSEDIMREYAHSDNRIVCISKKNGGPSSARNAGLEAANGEYVIFVDSDDVLEEGMIEYLYHMMSEDVDVAVCGYHNIDEDGMLISSDLSGKKEIQEERVYGEAEFWKICFEQDVCYCVVVWNKLIRREAIGNLRFPLGRYPDYPLGRYHEDDNFITGLWRKGIVMKCSPRKMYYYRIRRDGRALFVSAKQHSDNIDACLDRLDYFIERKLYYEADGTYNAILELMAELLNMDDKENKDIISTILGRLRKTSFGVIGYRVTLRTRCKAFLLCIMGRYYFGLRAFWRQGKEQHAD